MMLAGGLVLPVFAYAASALPFKDIPANSTLLPAVEYVKTQGLMEGYDDGTFRPSDPVNRAEAVKILLASVVTAEELKAYTTSSFADVPDNAWFMPYVEAALKKVGIIDGPPKATLFHPSSAIQKAQFLKMFFLSKGIDPSKQYGDLSLPLSPDVVKNSVWYFAPIRLALVSSMTFIGSDGLLHPDKPLLRGDLALLLYRHAMYEQGNRTQDLLSEAASEISTASKMLAKNKLDSAEQAADRSLLAARGALASMPDEPLVKGAVKTAEGFQDLVLAKRAFNAKNYDSTITLCSSAWQLAKKAKEFSSSLTSVATQMQNISKNLADSARKAQK